MTSIPDLTMPQYIEAPESSNQTAVPKVSSQTGNCHHSDQGIFCIPGYSILSALKYCLNRMIKIY